MNKGGKPVVEQNPTTPGGNGLSVILDPAAIAAVNAESRSRAATENLGKTQEHVRTDSAELSSKGADTDPDFAQSNERFEGWSQQDLYNAVHGPGGMDVAGLATARKVWNDAASQLGVVAFTMQARINTLLSDGALAGQAGDAARSASTRLGQTTNLIAQVFSAMRTRTEQLYYTAEALRAAVQPPVVSAVPSDPDDPQQSIIPGIPNPATITTTRAAEEQTRLANIAAMNTIYKPGYPPAGSGVPSYVFVPDALDNGGTPGTPGTPNTGPAAGKPTSPSSPQEGEPTATEQETPPTAPEQPEDKQPDQPASPTSTDQPTDPASTTPASTTPASATPTTAQPTLGTPGAGTPAMPGTPHAATPGPGASVPGTGGSAPTTAPAAPAGGANTRLGAHGPMGSMAPGAAGQRRGDDDSDHSIPDYLRQVQPDWLEGIEAAPGVIGADPDASDADDLIPASANVADMAGVATERFPSSPEPQPELPNHIPPFPTNGGAASAQPAPGAADPSAVTPAMTPQSPTMSPEAAALLAEYAWDPGESASSPASGTDAPGSERNPQ